MSKALKKTAGGALATAAPVIIETGLAVVQEYAQTRSYVARMEAGARAYVTTANARREDTRLLGEHARGEPDKENRRILFEGMVASVLRSHRG